MTPDVVQWANQVNRKKARYYSAAHQWANTSGPIITENVDGPGGTQRDVQDHGWATVAGINR